MRRAPVVSIVCSDSRYRTRHSVGTLATGVSRCLQLFEIRIRARNFCNRYMVSKRVQNNIQVVRGCGYLWKTSEWPVAVPFPSDFGKSNGDGQGPQVCVRSEEMNPLYDFPLSCANASGSLLCRTTKLPTAEEDLHPSRRLQVSSSSNDKIVTAVAAWEC